MLVMSSTIFQGEYVGLSGNQIIMLKTKTSDFSFDFNCYSISTTNDITVQNIATWSVQASLFEQGNFIELVNNRKLYYCYTNEYVIKQNYPKQCN